MWTLSFAANNGTRGDTGIMPVLEKTLYALGWKLVTPHRLRAHWGLYFNLKTVPLGKLAHWVRHAQRLAATF